MLAIGYVHKQQSGMCIHVQVDVLSHIHVIYSYMHAHSWAGRGVIDVPLQEVEEFFKHTENSISWDKYLVVSTT